MTFEEILQHAQRENVRRRGELAPIETKIEYEIEHALIMRVAQVDFLLHGGDMFHDNKPSRSTLYRTMQVRCWRPSSCSASLAL